MSKFTTTRNGLLFLAASLTLGLAPFVPEPHIWANLRWIAGGAVGMEAMNVWDTLMHGTPWLLLLTWCVVWLIVRMKAKRTAP